MTDPTQTPLRLAYIRTTVRPHAQSPSIRDFLSEHVWQSRPEELYRDAPRHRFLFSAGGVFDVEILDVLIAQIQARSPAEDHAPVVPNGIGRRAFQYMSRSDLELRVSESYASTAVGQKVLKRCVNEGIATLISGISDEECDELMLQDSDYLIDFLTHEHCPAFHTHFPNHIRTGIPQSNILTSPNYKMDRHDVSQYRLGRRYSGYGWKQSSGAYHGNGGDYRCGMCGGKCKRDICKGQSVNKARFEERQKWEKTEEAWIEEWLSPPMPGSEKWRDVTAYDLCWRFHMLSLPRYKNASRWHSVDTFSGE